ncbi:hypothetical protein [Erythrobacter phage vB_EliS-L02]|nr:hypothetical protein [Erythrobacter phage vB_EliS-L02]
MPKTGIVGKDRARSEALASIDKLEDKFARNLHWLVHEIDRHIKAVTPVNTGQAVRNYIWTRETPSKIVYDAIDNGDPGPTNSMALGQEPRRGVNEAAAAQSLTSLNLLGDPFGEIILTNNSPDIEGLEKGLLPGPPLRSRSPSGMFGITASYANVLARSKGMLK